jgi:hypothetical protein
MKLSTHNTEQMARGYLMYELAKRGYNVQFTDSRFPSEDLLVVSPHGRHFGIDVKGQITKNFWLIKEPVPNPEMFYALIYVPETGTPQVFILDNSTMVQLWHEYRNRSLANNPSAIEGHWGLNWKTPFPYENRYEILPE